MTETPKYLKGVVADLIIAGAQQKEHRIAKLYEQVNERLGSGGVFGVAWLLAGVVVKTAPKGLLEKDDWGDDSGLSWVAAMALAFRANDLPECSALFTSSGDSEVLWGRMFMLAGIAGALYEDWAEQSGGTVEDCVP